MDGFGTLTKNNAIFEGTFVKGEKSKGTMKTAYGNYEGKFKYGEMFDEKATFTWNDKKIYVGGFEFG